MKRARLIAGAIWRVDFCRELSNGKGEITPTQFRYIGISQKFFPNC